MAAYYIIPYITRIISYLPCIPWHPLRVCQSCSIHIWPYLVVCLYYRNHRSFTLKAGLRDETDRERRLPVLTTMTINPNTAFIQGTRVSRGRVPKRAADREVPVGFWELPATAVVLCHFRHSSRSATGSYLPPSLPVCYSPSTARYRVARTLGR